MRLLDDQQVKQFIATGCLELHVSELGEGFHQQLYERCCERDLAAGDLDNPELATKTRREVFVDIPELSRLIGSPTLTGALTSLLGPNFLQHPHRTMHTRPEGGGDQAWHKDGHHISMRHHRPRWLIGFYFPGATTAEMVSLPCCLRSAYRPTSLSPAHGTGRHRHHGGQLLLDCRPVRPPPR
jgi:hypothetical protein